MVYDERKIKDLPLSKRFSTGERLLERYKVFYLHYASYAS
jgi:hypothetical protein